jgi:protocatechuate 3,4-dioxygenase beta subunit
MAWIPFLGFIRSRKSSSNSRKPRRRTVLQVECLERREVLSTASVGTSALSPVVISGYVFNDLNAAQGNSSQGLRTSSDPGIAAINMELLDSGGNIVGTATTNANGFYQFSQNGNANTTPLTVTQTATLQNKATNWSQSATVSPFDTSLGTLVGVQVTVTDTMNNTVVVQDLDNQPGSVNFNVNGAFTLSGPGIASQTTTANFAGSLNASAGTDQQTFNEPPDTVTNTYNITSNLGAYENGNVSFSQTANAVSTITAGGNLLTQVGTSASANIQVVYTYIPSNSLQPGNYTIVELNDPAGYLDGLESSGGVVIPNSVGSNQINVTLGSTSLTENDFAKVVPANLSGFVYVDGNDNGQKDSGENGIAGVAIQLTGSDYTGKAVSLTATTSGNGQYSFANLLPGLYSVKETPPSGYLDGKDSAGTAGGTVGNDAIGNITLQSGTSDPNNNFAELQGSSLAGFVYVDANDNGIKDSGENGLGGVIVTLSGTNDQNQAVSLTATTASDGSYNFGNLRPGSYALAEQAPTGYIVGQDSAGSQGAASAANRAIGGITLPEGVNGINNNFAELQASSLAGFVYVDANDNGIKDSGENGLGGVIVTLSGTNDQNHSISLTTTTASDGSYSFGNLRPGSYALAEQAPNGYLVGKDSAGSQGATTAANRIIGGITLAEGVNGSNNNFAELQASSLAGFVYVDANSNGQKDSGENGLASVTIALTGTNDLSQAVSLTTATASDGSYSFGNLRPGSYTLTEQPPSGYQVGQDSAGSQGATTAANGVIGGITLAEGVAGVNNNFAALQPPGTLSGSVYLDANNNGALDSGEQGVQGVTITLTGTDATGKAINVTTTTGSDGSYRFTGLLSGTYQITETPPSALLDGKDLTVGTVNGITNGSYTAVLHQYGQVLLSGGASGVNYNYGEVQPASVQGTVYFDANSNGSLDAGEPGIPNVFVILSGTNSLGQPVTQAVSTDINGNYSFSGLYPGTYTINATTPTGFTPGKLNLGTGVLRSSVSNGSFVVPLTFGSAGVNYDFAEVVPQTAPPSTNPESPPPPSKRALVGSAINDIIAQYGW